ncbi:cutinase [Diplodia corticola]|uniref:cutinase n=1 Tax=Diplodia corticola TaxID=236234 RepID=A0A1J9RFF8_9PEZI|nr:cutinase [Diplodia corticola]OJD40262.1 cutinase [Diplodia corticola]
MPHPLLLLLFLPLLTTAAPLTPRQSSPSSCAPITVIFARGTTETGDLGAVVGPPLQAALEAKLPGKVAVQGVPAPAYPADVAGYLAGGSATGAAKMAEMAREVVAGCSGEEVMVVLAGYSQGGQLVHKAGAQLDAATAARVAGAVIFGDPDNPQPVENVENLKVFCAEGDLICEGQPVILAPHLSYGADAGAAADWIAGVTGN